jgi:hypothetical protein
VNCDDWVRRFGFSLDEHPLAVIVQVKGGGGSTEAAFRRDRLADAARRFVGSMTTRSNGSRRQRCAIWLADRPHRGAALTIASEGCARRQAALQDEQHSTDSQDGLPLVDARALQERRLVKPRHESILVDLARIADKYGAEELVAVAKVLRDPRMMEELSSLLERVAERARTPRPRRSPRANPRKPASSTRQVGVVRTALRDTYTSFDALDPLL